MKLKAIAILGLFVLSLSRSFNADVIQGVFRSESVFAGKRYTSQVVLSDLRPVPKWHSAEDWPPMKPRFAADSATNALAIVAPNIKWTMYQFSLVRVGEPGDWIYVVELGQVPETSVSDGHRDTFKIVVLLNGRAIHPVLEK